MNPYKGVKINDVSKKKKLSKGKKIALIVSLSVLGIILAIIVTLLILLANGKSELVDNNNTGLEVTTPDWIQRDDDYIFYNGHKYKFNKNITNVLIMGVDKRDFAMSSGQAGQGGQADALYLYSYDTANGKSKIISVSRDSMVDINLYDSDGNFSGTDNEQICLAYAYGDGKEKSCESMATAVSRMFYGIPINSYAAVDLDCIAKLNDTVGGVTVTVPQDDDIVFTDSTMKPGSTITLSGTQAELFVRQRNKENADTNNRRIERQKLYISAFINQALSMTKKNLNTPINIYNSVSDHTVTNLNISKISYLALSFAQNNFSGPQDIVSVPGTVKLNGNYVEFTPDEKKFYELIIETYYIQVD